MDNQNKNENTDQEAIKRSLDRLKKEKEDKEYDLTKEDKMALGPKDLSLDGGEDELLLNRKRKVDFAGEDLDVPGSELDDDQEGRGSEDEENNHYSLGSDQND